MARIKENPKRKKCCVFCNYWMGNADLKFVSPVIGYEYEHEAKGACTKRNCNTPAYVSCQNYEPGMETRKLL